MLLDAKQMKQKKKSGEIGPIVQHAKGGGALAHYVGEELQPRASGGFGQPVNLIAEFQNHIGFLIQLSGTKHRWLVFPKGDVVHWGLLERRQIPVERSPDHVNLVALSLVFGPIGALAGSAMDQAAENKAGSKPAVCITYKVNGSENAIFLEFPLSRWYRLVHKFLRECLPGLLKE